MKFHAANNVPASSLLPFPRNEFFIGREEQLQQLLDQSLFDPNHHKRMSLYGLGGCGKSAFALEFAYRALKRDASLLVFWVPAFSHESQQQRRYNRTDQGNVELGEPRRLADDSR
jgi:transcriptional regulator with AAA-type ATPase domain